MNKFVVCSGNNPQVIREALLKRGNWEEVFHFQTLAYINSSFSIQKIPEDDKSAWANAHMIWRPVNFSTEMYSRLDDTRKKNSKPAVQVFNHFENNRGMCTKTGLIRSLRSYYISNEEASTNFTQCSFYLFSKTAEAANYTVFESTPTSFILIAGIEDAESVNFSARFKDIARQLFQKESVPSKHCQDNIWLVKPANQNQGRGIEIFRKLKDIQNFLASKTVNTYWVVQKYIERPLLYTERKFDIRVWVLVTNKMEVYFFQKGYMRTSSDSYDLNNQNNYVHLTNNCLQQHGNNYGRWEDGNTLPYDCLKKWIKEKYPKADFDLEKHVLKRMKDLIIDSFLAWKKNLNPYNRKNCFELFGYDFLIDEDLRTWLIEVNTNPYLGIPNSFIADLLPRMIDNMFEIVLDPLFPPKEPRAGPKDNLFELIYSEQGSSPNEKPVNLRSSFTSTLYPVKALEQSKYRSKPIQTQNFDRKLVSPTESPSPLNKGRAISVESKLQMNPTLFVNSLDSIYKNLQAHVSLKNSLAYMDLESVTVQVSRILDLLEKPEQFQPNQLKTACKIIEIVSKSIGQGILSDKELVGKIAKLLNLSKLQKEVTMALLSAISNVSQETVLKKMICDKIIHSLNEILLSTCVQQLTDPVPELLSLVMKCTENVCGMNPHQLLVSSGSKENERWKYFYMSQGGIMTLCVVAKKSKEPQLREFAEKVISQWMTERDWSNQCQILESWAEYKSSSSSK